MKAQNPPLSQYNGRSIWRDFYGIKEKIERVMKTVHSVFKGDTASTQSLIWGVMAGMMYMY